MFRSSSLGYSNRGARDEVVVSDADVGEPRSRAWPCDCADAALWAAVMETQRNVPFDCCGRRESLELSAWTPARKPANERPPRCKECERVTVRSPSASKASTALLLAFLMMCSALSWWRTAKHTTTAEGRWRGRVDCQLKRWGLGEEHP